MARVLVVEDEPRVRRSLDEGLRAAGFEVESAADGGDGGKLAARRTFDCVILDWMLPGRDGLDILAAMRRSGDGTPVLLLTARDDIDDRVLGLESGADDYLVKPFAFPELVARVRVLLRRGRPCTPGSGPKSGCGRERPALTPQPALIAGPIPSGGLGIFFAVGRR